jgi:hypothetical protein
MKAGCSLITGLSDLVDRKLLKVALLLYTRIVPITPKDLGF